MAKKKPRHQVFPPGDYIREDPEYLGWTQGDLAEVMGRPVQVINQLINGKEAITARTARELEAALGTNAEMWLKLEMSWQLYQLGAADPAIAARAKKRENSRARAGA
jgi:HTH-type transcriptional regulator / antitoxin HigA